jgi:hypothetical protein
MPTLAELRAHAAKRVMYEAGLWPEPNPLWLAICASLYRII